MRVASMDSLELTPAQDAVTDCTADVTEALMSEYQGDLPLSIIASVVLLARRHLSGQVIDASFPELLLRLSRVRLAALTEALTA